MSKGSLFWANASGKLGEVVQYRAGGEQRARAYVRKIKNPIMYLFYGQLAIYLGLAFFTTWFSNPTTWFWLALTTMMFIFVGFKKKENKK